MRKLAVFALILLTLPPPQPGEARDAGLSMSDFVPSQEFPLDECVRKATHILVVDARGQILDVWKGIASRGEFVPIDQLLSPTFPKLTDRGRTQLLSLTEQETSWMARPHGERMILLLTKAPGPTAAERQFKRALDRMNAFTVISFRGREREEPIREGATAIARVDELVGVGLVRDGSVPVPEWQACSVATVDEAGWVRTLGKVTVLLTVRYGTEQPRVLPKWRIVGTEATFREQVWETLKGTRYLGWE